MFGAAGVAQDPANPDENVYTCSKFATYESAALDTDEDCVTLPVTLTRTAAGGVEICTGDFPSSLTLDSAI
jgi:hypothetical protein